MSAASSKRCGNPTSSGIFGKRRASARITGTTRAVSSSALTASAPGYTLQSSADVPPPSSEASSTAMAASSSMVVDTWETALALDQLPTGAHCPSCNIDYDRNYTQNVELVFQPARAVRVVDAREYCLFGPMSTPHVRIQLTVGPGETRTVRADLAPSTKTLIKASDDFSAVAYAERNMHFGIREHGMGAALNGMSLHGGILPYGATFLIFSDYARPSIRLASLMKLHVIYVFTHDSIGLGEDGPTHQPIETLAALRAIPGLTVLRPGDAAETVEAWRVAMNRKDGPVALVYWNPPAEGVELSLTIEDDQTDERQGITLFEEFVEEGGVVDAIEALHEVRVQHVLGLLQGRAEDGLDRIVSGSARSEPVAVGLELRFPFRFQGQFDQCLHAPIFHGRNAHSTLHHDPNPLWNM